MYADLVQQWGQTINLSSRRKPDKSWLEGQIETSLAVVPYLPPRLSRFIDLGSGQGLPAIPIAIVSGAVVDLVEADRRKAAFLTTALSKLRLEGAVWPIRIETAKLPASFCVTAQALAPLPKLLEFAKPLLRVGGCCLFLKGSRAEAEVSSLDASDDFRAELISLGPLRSHLVKITRLH